MGHGIAPGKKYTYLDSGRTVVWEEDINIEHVVLEDISPWQQGYLQKHERSFKNYTKTINTNVVDFDTTVQDCAVQFTHPE